MKKVLCLFFIFAIVLASCGPKPYYKTAKGKKKLKYYNSLQFGGKPVPPPKKN
ncbi:MAG: hypothetical protein HC859_07890 [Bacteroidia bacterium]|nr:hypothetical protein [Bacteroidia bacterium]